MNEKLLAVMAAWVGQSPEDFKVSVESSPEAVAAQLAELKVLTADNFNAALTNRVKAMSKEDIALMPESIRLAMYNNSKAAALESKEKELQEEYGTAFKKDTDYNTTNELVRLITEQKSKKKDGEPDKFEKLYNETKTSTALEIAKVKTDAIEREKSLVKAFAIEGITSIIPKEEAGKVDFIQFQFDKEFDIEITAEGKQIPVNKSTGKYEVDENHNILSVGQAMRRVASTVVSLTQEVPNAGRGSQQQASAQERSSSAYKTVDDFIEKGLQEKGVIPSSIEGQKLIAEYMVENK